MCGGDDGAGEITILRANACEESGLALGGKGQPVVGDEFDERVGNVGEGLGGGSGISPWHIGDAVVEDALLDEDGVIVSRGSGGFGATPLIDGDIHEDAAWSHPTKHVTGNKFRRLGAWNEDSTNQ